MNSRHYNKLITASAQKEKLKKLVEEFGGIDSVLKAIKQVESLGGLMKAINWAKKKDASYYKTGLYKQAGFFDRIKKLVQILLLAGTIMGVAESSVYANPSSIADELQEAFNQPQQEEVQENKRFRYDAETVMEKAQQADKAIKDAVEKHNTSVKEDYKGDKDSQNSMKKAIKSFHLALENSQFADKYDLDQSKLSKYLESFYGSGWDSPYRGQDKEPISVFSLVGEGFVEDLKDGVSQDQAHQALEKQMGVEPEEKEQRDIQRPDRSISIPQEIFDMANKGETDIDQFVEKYRTDLIDISDQGNRWRGEGWSNWSLVDDYSKKSLETAMRVADRISQDLEIDREDKAELIKATFTGYAGVACEKMIANNLDLSPQDFDNFVKVFQTQMEKRL